MRRLSQIILILIFGSALWGQSPHGERLVIDCASCHSPENWSFDRKNAAFSHDITRFSLKGQHKELDCRLCHSSLIFDEASPDCNSCHRDIHQKTVGNDCARCHNSSSWIVTNIYEVHERTNFPLIGVHKKVNCSECHQNVANNLFDPLDINCVSCHLSDYQMTTRPNHSLSGFSDNCSDCHDLFSHDWKSNGVNHSFFPLEKGHNITDCAACHKNENYRIISNDCVSCHQADYDNTVNPNHKLSGIQTDCKTCHTTDPDWNPAVFKEHDELFFPIYSGKHKGKWDNCTECHDNPSNYAIFTCTSCHKKPETDHEHDEVAGYHYDSGACLACHPTGNEGSIFNHNTTGFPLTGAHTTVNCQECHTNGYKGTSTACNSCHQDDYDASVNPSHPNLGLPTDCAQCHTTQPDWKPATFEIHNDFYALNGKHAAIANDCAACHNGDYNNTPNSCYGCHSENYNSTTDPDHKTALFPQDCASCHSENAWVPSTFEHDGLYFPIYSGKHKGEWDQCQDCHQVAGDFKQFTCISCHQNPETNEEHEGVSGYVYTDNACLACHPSGDADAVFDHSTTGFLLTGGHSGVDCASCHASGYEGTSPDCASCHTIDYNLSQNPSHTALNLSTDCAMCHTTQPGWNPARFEVHNQFYSLNGAHAVIANDCAACHNGNYTNTPNTCNACHAADFNATTDPNHVLLQFPDDCASCHSENAWTPSTFNHDGQYFPIYSGKHKGEWDQCMDCHNNPGDFGQFTCINCHTNPETNEEHEEVQGYFYSDAACLACHPTGEADDVFDHGSTGFLLSGGHSGVDCISCHSGGFSGTNSECVACHQNDFDQSINPSHVTLGMSTDCTSCHTTNPGWSPASFSMHNEFYPILGAHTSIANDCAACHAGNYTNTPNTCIGCHQTDFNNTSNPNHGVNAFPTDCALCHEQNAWTPSSFDHDVVYPLTGGHAAVAQECTLCHNGNYNNTPNNCQDCHQADFNNTMNPNHNALGFSTDCTSCHTTDPGWEPALMPDHNSIYLIEGAHTTLDCAACHNGNYNNTPNTCFGCHADNYNNTTDPDHQAGAYPNDCTICHSQNTWTPASFDHNSVYPLTGGHALIAEDCALCHQGSYSNTPNTCQECHQTHYNGAENPNHVNLGFSNDCAVCHTTNPGWEPALMPDHNSFYLIEGAHTGLDCAACHNGNYNNTPNTCFGCHADNYNNTTDPDHQAGAYPNDCTICHSQNTWTPASFDHNSVYPLTGGHALIAEDCALCHQGSYSNTPNTCQECHQTHYNGAENPNHVNLGFSNDCAVCHTTNPGWEPALMPDHNSFYVIEGAHTGLDCAACHNGNYNNTPNTCFGCHSDDYSATTDPNHAVEQFPVDCASCHSQTAWTPSTFDHNNFWPLTGGHALVANNCNLCHNGNYSNTPNLCSDCHTSDYMATTNPNHNALGLPMDCAMCHTTEPQWNPAQFPIHNDFYVLEGAHTGLDCVSCHGGNYNSTPNTCFGCHAADYNNTTNPNHQAAQFPTDCTSCHSQNSWTPSTFDHDNMYFPIYSGKHEGEWDLCSDCHINSGNYSIFSCINCHEHSNQGEVDNDHDEVNGYVYESNACYACHPDGSD